MFRDAGTYFFSKPPNHMSSTDFYKSIAFCIVICAVILPPGSRVTGSRVPEEEHRNTHSIQTVNSHRHSVEDRVHGYTADEDPRINNRNAVRIVLKPNTRSPKAIYRTLKRRFDSPRFGQRIHNNNDFGGYKPTNSRRAFSAWAGKRSENKDHAIPDVISDNSKLDITPVKDTQVVVLPPVVESIIEKNVPEILTSRDHHKPEFTEAQEHQNTNQHTQANKHMFHRTDNQQDLETSENGIIHLEDRKKRELLFSDFPTLTSESAVDSGAVRIKRSLLGAGEGFEKRQGTFQPWGGKRSVTNIARLRRQAALLAKNSDNFGQRKVSLDEGENEIPDKKAFSAWGGKRADEQVPGLAERLGEDEVLLKRAFSAWGGKRGSNEGEISQEWENLSEEEKKAFSSWVSKRAFSAWAGKRSHLGQSDADEAKRAFSAWAGKRGSSDELMSWTDMPAQWLKREVEEKRAFSAWSGKRGSLDDAEKRAFSAWSGKRGSPDDAEKRAFSAWSGKRGSPNDTEKRAFSAWSGKRAFSAWGGKRGSHDSDEKRAFSAWSGKRSGFNDDAEKRAFSAWAGKRGISDESEKRAFSAWAGKRSSSDQAEKRAFSAWAGKRSGERTNDELLMKLNPGLTLPTSEKLKRSPSSMDLEYLSNAEEALQRSSPHPYGPLLLSLLAHDYDSLNNDIKVARRAFSAWAGKRGDMAHTLSSLPEKRAIDMDPAVLAHLLSKPWRNNPGWGRGVQPDIEQVLLSNQLPDSDYDRLLELQNVSHYE